MRKLSMNPKNVARRAVRAGRTPEEQLAFEATKQPQLPQPELDDRLKKDTTATKPEEKLMAKYKEPEFVVLTGSLAKSVGAGYYKLTELGEKVIPKLETMAVFGKRGNFLTLLSRSMFVETPFKIDGHSIVEVRPEGMSAITAIETDIPHQSTKSLRKAHKALTRAGVAFGMDGLGHANPNLKKYEVGISLENMHKLHVVTGQHVLMTRIPQGSGTASLVEVTVQESRTSGIQLSPELAILLGGDCDSDRYYIYKMNHRRFSASRDILMNISDILKGAENPAVLDNLPKRKETEGLQDRLQVKSREVVGAFTTMGYHAIMTAKDEKEARQIADEWFPSQELIFDLKKINVNANIVDELVGIMTTPIRYRYYLMKEFALATVQALQKVGAEDYYVAAFGWLYSASVKAAANVTNLINALEDAQENNEVDKELLKKVLYLEPYVVPDLKDIESIIKGKGASWFGSSFTNLLAKERGEDEEDKEITYVIKPCNLFESNPLLEDRTTLPIPTVAYLLGTPTSNLSIIREGSNINIYLQYMQREKLLHSIPISIRKEVAGIPIVSGEILTGVVSRRRVVSTYIDANGIHTPLHRLIDLIHLEVDRAFGDSEYLESKLLSRTSMPDVYQAIRKAEREWFSGSDIIREDELELAYQLKSVRIAPDVTPEVLDTLKERIGSNWEYRSTKNGDKGHILPVPGTSLHSKMMRALYNASVDNAALMPAHRVNSEQLPSHNCGHGMCHVLVMDVEGLTYGTTRSSFDALKKELGLRGESGISATDSGLIFEAIPFKETQSIQCKSRDDADEIEAGLEADSWTVTREEDEVILRDSKGEPLSITEGDETFDTIKRITLRATRDRVTTEGEAYKIMFGPGAKGMFLYLPQEITAKIGDSDIKITAAVSMTSLKSKNALQACLDGTARVANDWGNTLESLKALGSDEVGRFPVSCNGEVVGYFSIMEVPYWMLPANTEATRIRKEPWVAPISNASQLAKEVNVSSTNGTITNYIEAMIPYYCLRVMDEYLEWCGKAKHQPNMEELGKLQVRKLQTLLRSKFNVAEIE